jgi:hypothetical protein
MFGILVFFVMIIIESYTKEGFAVNYVTQDNKYEKGGDVNINGKYSNGYERYNTFGPFSTTITSSAKCKADCIRQDECNKIRGNKCESTFDEKTKTCFCSFRKRTHLENFDGIKETTINLRNLLRKFPNEAKPSWIYPKTKHKYKEITDIASIPWSDLNIPDNNNMAFSFWIYTEDNVVDNNGFFVLSINRLVFPIYVSKNKTLVIRNIRDYSDVNVNAAKPTWVTVSFSPGVQNVYVNGVFTHSSTTTSSFLPPDEKSKLTLGQGAKGIYVKDLKFYDHSLTEEGIKLLYKE